MPAILPFLLIALAFAQRFYPSLLPLEPTHIITLVAAFLGSASAFLLEERRRRRQNIDERHSVIFRAQLVLLRQLDSLLNLTTHYLDTYRNHPNRALLMGPFYTGVTDLRVDFGSLWFVPLIDSDTNLIHRIYLAESSFLTSTGMFNMRNNEMRRFMSERAKYVQSFNPTTGELRMKSTMELELQVKLITDMTNGLYDSTDGAILQLETAIRDVRAMIRRVYPGRKSVEYKGRAKPNDGEPASVDSSK
jgi:hypothetical protein